MSPELAAYIGRYGYIAIFSLVFLQEIGVPNPIANELVLLFSGYLTSMQKLDFITVLITVITADTLGTSLLYIMFYYFGKRVLQKWPHFISTNKLAYLTTRVSHQNRWSIYLGGCPRISTSDPLSCGYACGSYIQMAIILDI